MSLGSFNTDRNDVVESGYVGGVVTVGTSQVEAKVGGARVATRQIVILFNDSSNTIYYGPTGVTTSGSSKGIPLEKSQWVALPIGDQGLFLIAGSASNNVIVQEIS